MSEVPNPGAFSWRNPIILTILLATLVLFVFQAVHTINTQNRLSAIAVDLELMTEQTNALNEQTKGNAEQLVVANQLLVAAGEQQEEILRRLKVILDNEAAKTKEAELGLQRWQMRWIKLHLAQAGCQPSEELDVLYDAQTRAAISCWQASRDETPTGFFDRESIRLLLGSAVSFRDCDDVCPTLALIPPGEFLMGSEASEKDGKDNERPRHAVEIAYPFAMGAYEITLEEWAACVDDGVCNPVPLRRHAETDAGRRPITHVNWHEATAYAEWLSDRTGMAYRLPSEAEWEYTARANTTTPFFNGVAVTSKHANFDGRYDWRVGTELTPDVYMGRTLDVGILEPNAFGVHDVHGNANEWTQDCYVSHYRQAPADGRARETDTCTRRVLRGGSWKDKPWDLRSARRHAVVPDARSSEIGFRVLRTFDD